MPSGIVEIVNKKNIKFKGYVTAPATGVYPGILLLHQEFGIDANIRYIAEYLAANNYTVFVPDLFWRSIPGCEIDSSNNEKLLEINDILKKYNINDGLDDVTLCLKWLRETPQCNGLVSTIGYGIGSNLSYLSGLWLDIESSVCHNFKGYDFFDEKETSIRRPMLVHLSNDCYKTLLEKKKNSFFENKQNVNLKVYDNCKGSFYRIADNLYNKEQTIIVNNFTLEHIKEAFAKPHTT